MVPTPDTDTAFAQFSHVLREEGLRPALAYLLGLTDYRYIAIFRFRDDEQTTAVYYDRENPEALQSDTIPASATYCCFVRDEKGVFTTVDAMRDPRLASFAAREAIRAYCGVPVLTPDGEILGTLCHFDSVPRDSDQIDIQLMLQVASALEQTNSIPEYPD
ncbi:MAG: GAF domain-containing protein [Thiobacillus sp.]|nr:GAF domain-containing protein [Thiobacillus sp.]